MQVHAAIAAEAIVLEHGPVKVFDPVVAHIGQGAADVAKSEISRLAEYAGVEKAIQALARLAGQLGAVAVVVWPGAAPERVGQIVCGAQEQRCAALRSPDSVQFPAGDQPGGGTFVIQPSAALPERQFDRVVDDEALRRVEGVDGTIKPPVVVVLETPGCPARLEPANSSFSVSDSFAQGVGGSYHRPLEAPGHLELHGVINRGAEVDSGRTHAVELRKRTKQLSTRHGGAR